MRLVAHPEYLEMCRSKSFLLSKAVTAKDGFACLQDISESKQKIEVEWGAKMGAGGTREFLEPRGFPDETPLGADQIIMNETLNLHHGQFVGSEWVGAFGEYGNATKFGVLILAKTTENFQRWASSKACLKEVKNIPNGRLFAYIEHTEEDEGGRKGYIVHIDAENGQGAATVKNGIGYVLWHNGDFYHGELKDGLKHGHGTVMNVQ